MDHFHTPAVDASDGGGGRLRAVNAVKGLLSSLEVDALEQDRRRRSVTGSVLRYMEAQQSHVNHDTFETVATLEGQYQEKEEQAEAEAEVEAGAGAGAGAGAVSEQSAAVGDGGNLGDGGDVVGGGDANQRTEHLVLEVGGRDGDQRMERLERMMEHLIVEVGKLNDTRTTRRDA